MLVSHQTPLDLNVTITVLDANHNLVRRSKFKNTATKRMTTAIAMFLAGDHSTYDRYVGTSDLGRWRPNFISFGTTGIDEQPTSIDGTATVLDPEAFADKLPDPELRTRPWFFSKNLGERGQGFWNPSTGWKGTSTGNRAVFQGELATGSVSSDQKAIGRHPILRADVTQDNAWDREAGAEGYSSDCILYGYSSVLWSEQFFNPENGPSVPKIAISEFGLYEMDSDTEEGRDSLMAGFRVPTVDDIVYVEPGYVVLVEWRVTIRALMPYELVQGDPDYKPLPTGISLVATVANDNDTSNEKHVQFTSWVMGPSLVSQNVIWSLLEGATKPGTQIDQTGLLTLAPNEGADVLYVRCQSAILPEIYSTSAVITGLIRNLITGITISTIESTPDSIQLQAQVLGKGTFVRTVTWEMTGQQSPDTTITQDGLITFDPEEQATNITVKATSNGDNEIWSIASVIRIDKTTGIYTISDFSILT